MNGEERNFAHDVPPEGNVGGLAADIGGGMLTVVGGATVREGSWYPFEGTTFAGCKPG